MMAGGNLRWQMSGHKRFEVAVVVLSDHPVFLSQHVDTLYGVRVLLCMMYLPYQEGPGSKIHYY